MTAPHQPGHHSFTVTPTQLMVGQPVTFTGDGCRHKGNVTVVGIATGSLETPINIHPDVNRHWTTTVTVGDSTLLGSRSVAAYCYRVHGVKPLFRYDPVTVNVSTYRRLQVTPGTSVHAGTTLYVKAIGACAKPFAADYGATLEFTNHPVDESKYVQL